MAQMEPSNICETQFRSYVEARTRELENTFKDAVQNGENVDVAVLEEQIDEASDTFIADVTERLHQVRDDIKNRRPTNEAAPDYEVRLEQYQRFVMSSTAAVDRITNWASQLFNRLFEIAKSIGKWLSENAQTIMSMQKHHKGHDKTAAAVSSSATLAIREKYKKLKTLVLKLKPTGRSKSLSSLNSEQLDSFIDDMIGDLEKTIVSNTNELRTRIKEARPEPGDPQYEFKMALYEELLKEMIPIMHSIQNLIQQMLDDLRVLIDQLWHDILKNDGKNIDQLLEAHANTTETKITDQWMKPLDAIERNLEAAKNRAK